MGSVLSTAIFQPLLLGLAITLMIVALIYQKRQCATGNDNYGSEVFQINVAIATSIVIVAVIIAFLSALLN